jgi:hypothetical protein
MAAICVELRMTPGDYWHLRADEHAALVDELKARVKQAKEAAKRG